MADETGRSYSANRDSARRPWQPLQRFRDAGVPKLNNLRRAAAARLRVPATWWLQAESAAALSPAEAPTTLGRGPLIIRSGSPSEDQDTTSNAGQFLSLVVQERSEFPSALARVAASLPRGADGKPLGVVFVQPLLEPLESGVALFDGFYYERALATGGNQEVTSGQKRGDVTRSHLTRDDPWSQWLQAVHGVFANGASDARLDIEFARDADGFVLLQVRPALFLVRRNETLTLANSLETLGETPSPWTASA
ncbi:MAG TPA: hypothetical protein VGY58_11665, partial [Gemmataceae bacterium]|nr:hypothetical protein [Gemmataceae bacterium]